MSRDQEIWEQIRMSLPLICWLNLNKWYVMLCSVLLYRRTRRVGHKDIGRAIKAVELGSPRRQDLRKTGQKRLSDLRTSLRFVFRSGLYFLSLIWFLINRKDNWFENSRPQETSGPGPQENTQRLGWSMRRVYRKGGVHQKDRRVETQIREGRALIPNTYNLVN